MGTGGGKRFKRKKPDSCENCGFTPPFEYRPILLLSTTLRIKPNSDTYTMKYLCLNCRAMLLENYRRMRMMLSKTVEKRRKKRGWNLSLVLWTLSF